MLPNYYCTVSKTKKMATVCLYILSVHSSGVGVFDISLSVRTSGVEYSISYLVLVHSRVEYCSIVLHESLNDSHISLFGFVCVVFWA